jgi:hypothetical protein
MGMVKNVGQITVASEMVGMGTRDEHLKKIVSECLKVLPEGTTHLQTILKSVEGLAIPFEMQFEHPCFGKDHAIQDGDLIQIDYIRSCYPNPSPVGETILFVNVMTGFRYLSPNLTPRFP